MAKINDLSSVLLREILSKTNLIDWIKTLPYVCKMWKVLMPSVWAMVDGFKYKFWDYHPGDIDEEFVVFIKNRELFHNVVSIAKWNGKREITNAGFTFVTSRLSNEEIKLISLDLENNDKEGRFFADKSANLKFLCDTIGNKFNKLHSLELRFSNILNIVENVAHIFCLLENLEKIQIIYDYTEHSKLNYEKQMIVLLTNIFSICKKLRRVEIWSNNVNTCEIFNNLDALPILEEFKFSQTSLDGINLHFLQQIFRKLINCSNDLKSVTLDFSLQHGTVFEARQCGKVMSEFGAKKSITKLTLIVGLREYYIALYSRKTNQIRNFPFWAGFDEIYPTLIDFKDLQDLTLINANLLQTSLPQTVQRLADRLTTLNLIFTFNLDDSFFETFNNGMSKLKSLNITFEQESHRLTGACVTEQCLVEFLVKCPQLIRLKLQYLRNHDLSIIKFFTHLHNCLHDRTHVVNVDKDSTVLGIIIEDPLLREEENKEEYDQIQTFKVKHACCFKMNEKDDFIFCRLSSRLQNSLF